jgi:probable phosphoglycerate mutase
MAGNRILLWRHGQTDWNVLNRFQGHSDIALNPLGEYQARHAAEILAGMEPTKIISSDLSRAHNTALSLAEIINLDVLIDQRLRETNGGNWEGKTGAQNKEEDFANFFRWIDGDDNPAGVVGERRSEVAARARAAITDALGEETDQLLVVATHGGTARCVLGDYLQLPLSHWGKLGGLSNASWSLLQQSSKGWYLEEHNAGSIPEELLGVESGASEN